MRGISSSIRLISWFLLCVGMAMGMIVFAIFYGVSSFLMKKLVWKRVSVISPNIKLNRDKLAI